MYQEGQYSVTIEGGTTTENNNGNPLVAVKFTPNYMLDGNSTWQHCPSSERTLRLYLTDSAMKYTERKLEALGFNGRFGPDMAFTDEAVVLICTHEVRDGKTYENWELPQTGGREYKQAEQKTIMELNAKWKAKHGRPPAPSTPPPPRQSEPVEDAPDNDDVPF